MKILYAVQATGNGHISRAIQLLSYLKKYGEVDIFLSGNNATLPVDLPVKYKSKGLSLYYRQCGGLDYWTMWRKNSLKRAWKEAKDLPVEKYNLIINDFEYITSKACKWKKKDSVQFGHQASFQSPHTPRPENRSVIGEKILMSYASATRYLGLHFEAYDQFILPPVIKQEILEANATDDGSVVVYLPSYQKHCIEPHFLHHHDVHFHWFLHEIKSSYTEGNITYHPISNKVFTERMIHCHGVITGGGFETPAEVLYLKKKLLSIPIRDHYEQKCNAAALKMIGVKVLDDFDETYFKDEIREWLESPRVKYTQKANDVKSTLEKLFVDQ